MRLVGCTAELHCVFKYRKGVNPVLHAFCLFWQEAYRKFVRVPRTFTQAQGSYHKCVGMMLTVWTYRDLTAHRWKQKPVVSRKHITTGTHTNASDD